MLKRLSLLLLVTGALLIQAAPASAYGVRYRGGGVYVRPNGVYVRPVRGGYYGGNYGPRVRPYARPYYRPFTYSAPGYYGYQTPGYYNAYSYPAFVY